MTSTGTKTLASHTPGPWRCSCGGGEVIGNSRVVATMAWCSGFGPEDEANASLVAAAPDLLGALRFILAFYEPGQRHLDTNAWKVAEASARAAVAKAEGLTDDQS